MSLSAIASLSYWFTLQPRVIIAAVGAEPLFFAIVMSFRWHFYFTFLSERFFKKNKIYYKETNENKNNYVKYNI